MLQLVKSATFVENAAPVSSALFNSSCPADSGRSIALQNRAVHAVYQSILEPEPWSTFLSLMTEYLKTADATIVVRPSSGHDLGYLVSRPGNREVEMAYSAGWYKSDPFLDLPAGRVMLLADVVTEEQWCNCPFNREFLGRFLDTDPTRVMGVNIRTRAGTVSRLRLHRMASMPPFSEDDRERLAAFIPHIEQAMTLAAHVHRNESEREIYEEGLDRLNIGVIVLDETGQLLRANPVACHMLNGGDGIKLVDRHLEACSAADTRELRRLLASSQEDPGTVTAMSFMRPSGRRKLAAVIRSIPLVEESEGKSRAAWAVFLRDPDAPASAAQDIARQLFDFTPAEAVLAIELVNGLSLDEAAEKLGIRRNTVRAHLRAIFSKAGVTRQSELVRIMLNGVFGLSAAER